MNPTSTHQRATTDGQRTARRQPVRAGARRPAGDGSYASYVDGANALQIDFLDPAEDWDVPVRPGPATRPAPRRMGARPVPARDETRARRTRPELDRVTRGGEAPADVTAPDAPPTPVAVPRAPFLALVLGAVVAGVLGILVINTKINENAFHLDDLRAKQATLDLQEQQLAQQLADRESPGNLAAAAKRLGLVPAGTPAFITLPDGRIVGIPEPAVGQTSVTATSADPGR
jgi:hypothetical protein